MNGKTTSSECWTDEKHSQYLSSMEASFVRTMLENKARPLRLDRYLPDTSDSTLDSMTRSSTQRAKSLKSGISDYNNTGPRGRIDGGSDKRSRRRTTSLPFNSSEDQVVPQLKNRNIGDKDEKEHQNVP